MGIHEGQFCKICGTLFGEEDCTHEPNSVIGIAAEYFEIVEEPRTCLNS